jgi:hypothetical protein
LGGRGRRPIATFINSGTAFPQGWYSIVFAAKIAGQWIVLELSSCCWTPADEACTLHRRADRSQFSEIQGVLSVAYAEWKSLILFGL